MCYADSARESGSGIIDCADSSHRDSNIGELLVKRGNRIGRWIFVCDGSDGTWCGTEHTDVFLLFDRGFLCSSDLIGAVFRQKRYQDSISAVYFLGQSFGNFVVSVRRKYFLIQVHNLKKGGLRNWYFYWQKLGRRNMQRRDG